MEDHRMRELAELYALAFIIAGLIGGIVFTVGGGWGPAVGASALTGLGVGLAYNLGAMSYPRPDNRPPNG
jgi:hypothetical protein